MSTNFDYLLDDMNSVLNQRYSSTEVSPKNNCTAAADQLQDLRSFDKRHFLEEQAPIQRSYPDQTLLFEDEVICANVRFEAEKQSTLDELLDNK